MRMVGMDEVGRGAWAGPVVVGAVLLGTPPNGLRDSKMLTKQQRERLSHGIQHTSSWSVGEASVAEIDALGLTAALRLAYARAIAALDAGYDEIIIDGNYNYLAHLPASRMLIKADQLVPAVSAASVVAKVYRDRLMMALAAYHPVYGFERHVGYGTRMHREALAAAGPCAVHRRSFAPIRALLDAPL